MKYMGYEIEWERDHVVVTSPDGVQWREDSVTDAKLQIKEEIDNE